MLLGSHHLNPSVSPLRPFAAHIPLFLYPFLNTVSKTRPFEYLRLTSLGVIGALVKVSQPLRISTVPITSPPPPLPLTVSPIRLPRHQ